MDHLVRHGGTRVVPQSEPMRADQVANSAGGHAWELDVWGRLRRFLILGTEGGSYYASEKELTIENVEVVRECIQLDGGKTIAAILDVSVSGAARSNDPALYALAACLAMGDHYTKLLAGQSLPKVARTGTHLYHFVAYMETMRGWGRMARKAVQGWYDSNPEQLALQAVKYRQRDGWSHRDLLRLAHPDTADPSLASLFDWICRGDESERATVSEQQEIVFGFSQAQRAETPAQTAKLVREYRLPREALLTEHLTDPDVWRALLDVGMPLGAMTRNLANMTRHGVLSGAYLRLVVGAITDAEAIRKSRLHPMAILIAQRTYAMGHGWRSTNAWSPVPDVTDALDDAFYMSFDNVVPSGKRHLLALDVSGSMASGMVAGAPISPREASAAMALVTLHAEPDVEIVGFAHSLLSLGLSRRQRLDDAVRAISGIPFGATDCALPMLHAARNQTGAEAFVVYTDSETWYGDVHPKQALDRYRQMSGINARSVVVGMVPNRFTIADPLDAGMMDVCGFDAGAPALMSEFIAGRL